MSTGIVFAVPIGLAPSNNVTTSPAKPRIRTPRKSSSTQNVQPEHTRSVIQMLERRFSLAGPHEPSAAGQ